MAQYTMTSKATPYTMVSTYQTYVAQGSQYKWTNATNNKAEMTFDFSAIPENATIESVDFNYRYSDSKAGSGYQTIRKGYNLWDYVTNANLKRWLENESKKIKIMTSFKGNDNVYTSDIVPPTAARSVRTFDIVVTYSVNGESYVMYGTADGWQLCEPYYIEDGVAQKCDAYYGDNGEWVKASNE